MQQLTESFQLKLKDYGLEIDSQVIMNSLKEDNLNQEVITAHLEFSSSSPEMAMLKGHQQDISQQLHNLLNYYIYQTKDVPQTNSLQSGLYEDYNIDTATVA